MVKRPPVPTLYYEGRIIVTESNGKAIPAINSVEGFNPADYVRVNTEQDGSVDAYLDPRISSGKRIPIDSAAGICSENDSSKWLKR